MTISTFEAAKTLGFYSNWNLSNLQMQKILYLAHMFFMGRNQGEPLINENFEAWDYGPVIPSLYHEVKFFGNSKIKDIFFHTTINETSKESKIIKEAVTAFGNAPPAKLVAITHNEEGAWAKHYVQNAKGIVIPNADIIKEYNSL